MKKQIKNKEEKDSFESSLKKAEEIASLLESGSLSLTNRIKKFEEGINLLNKCEKELMQADLIIKKVIDKDGKIELSDL